jgi:predicted 2-oxoglutarate/Fe(II)-dependent dioxygenase YbiX
MLRILAVVPIDENHDRALDDVIANLPPLEEHAGRPLGAPVLVLPRVFEPEFCQDLIAQYEAQGGAPSGFMREVDGMTRLVNDNAFKRRSDCIITDEALQAAIIERIERRLAPGVRAAFQFAPTRVERYLVACYDAGSGGFFKAHRDNTTKGTAHRRFAVTINLNTEDYDGGDLRFPEFGSQTYRAPTGGAVVFGCSLLHEACPVTRGRRYAFLPFLFDEAGEAIRRQNLKFVEGSDGPPPGQSVVNP